MNWPTINKDVGINELLLQRFFQIILKGINEDKIRLVSVNSFVLYLTSLSIMQYSDGLWCGISRNSSSIWVRTFKDIANRTVPQSWFSCTSFQAKTMQWTTCKLPRDDLFSDDFGFKINTLVTKPTNHTFQKYCIFRGNFTFSSMEIMETRGEPSDNCYFAKGPCIYD
jgi:hypothetical protein